MKTKLIMVICACLTIIYANVANTKTQQDEIILVEWTESPSIPYVTESPSISYVPITAKINNTVSLTFMLDTAAVHSTISPSAAEKLGLQTDKNKPIWIAGVSEDLLLDVTNETEVQLQGSSYKHNIRFLIEDSRRGGLPEGISGVLSQNLLTGTRIQNNPKTHLSIKFIDPGFSCDIYNPTPQCGKLYDYQPLISGHWRGQEADFWIDTGAIELDDSVMLVSEDSSKFWYENYAALPPRNIAAISKLNLRYIIEDDVVFEGKKACPLSTFIKDPEDGSFTTDKLTFLLGVEYLKHVNFTIDFTDFTTDFSVPQCDYVRRNTSGIEMFATDPETDEKLNVIYIDPGSPAWNAGLRQGDVIVGIVGINDEYITDFGESFAKTYQNNLIAPQGSEIVIFILRDGEVLQKELISKEYQRLE